MTGRCYAVHARHVLSIYVLGLIIGTVITHVLEQLDAGER